MIIKTIKAFLLFLPLFSMIEQAHTFGKMGFSLVPKNDKEKRSVKEKIQIDLTLLVADTVDMKNFTKFHQDQAAMYTNICIILKKQAGL